MNRRDLLKLAIAAPMINIGRFRLFADTRTEYSTRTIDLMKSSLVIDMLSPFTLSDTRSRQLLSNPESWTAADLQNYRDSGINAFNISTGIDGPEAYLSVLQFIAGWNGFIAHHSEHLERIDRATDLDIAKRSGRIGVIVGLQNSEHFRTTVDVDFFFGLGQRVSQLTYNARNMIGNGSTERVDDGISDFGVSIIERMNKVGMAVDVSHCGDRTTLDAFEFSKQPVLITHSNCRALVNGHPRAKSDEAIRRMAAQGGVMGITGLRMFVKADEPTTIENVLDHYDYVRKMVGVEHLGVGSDIDLFGYDHMPPEELEALKARFKGSYGFRDRMEIDGLDHPRRMFNLTEGLIRRKYSDDDIRLVLGGNFRRVLAKIWPA